MKFHVLLETLPIKKGHLSKLRIKKRKGPTKQKSLLGLGPLRFKFCFLFLRSDRPQSFLSVTLGGETHVCGLLRSCHILLSKLED